MNQSRRRQEKAKREERLLVDQEPWMVINKDSTVPETFVGAPPSEYRVCAILQLSDNTLVTSYRDGTIRRWLVPLLGRRRPEDGGGDVSVGSSSRGGDRDTVTCEGVCLQIFREHRKSARCLVELDSHCFISGSDDGFLKLWKVEANSCNSGESGRYNTSVGVSLGTLVDNDRVNCVLILSKPLYDNDSNSKALVSGADDGGITIWNTHTRLIVQTIEAHSQAVLSLCELQDGTLVSASKDCKSKLWNITTGECIKTFKKTDYDINGMAELNNGVLVVTCASGEVSLVNRQKGNKMITLKTGWGRARGAGGVAGANCLVKLSNGFGFAVRQSSPDMKETTIRGWNETGELLFAIRVPKSTRLRKCECIALLNDDSLACGLVDGSIELWKPRMRIRSLVELSSAVVAMTYAWEELEGYLIAELYDACMAAYQRNKLARLIGRLNS
eukprot:TRINITY_DN1307_c0_g1_i3.p1 TRINITY_DN1307_c0_g1~~TRINITY_DN1307_c0_g1_i3.p1  ORF type:complete len:444 (+),score=51.42 TRINITY_DN1307_c0_g1_i3:149-1480(+)